MPSHPRNTPPRLLSGQASLGAPSLTGIILGCIGGWGAAFSCFPCFPRSAWSVSRSGGQPQPLFLHDLSSAPGGLPLPFPP